MCKFVALKVSAKKWNTINFAATVAAGGTWLSLVHLLLTGICLYSPLQYLYNFSLALLSQPRDSTSNSRQGLSLYLLKCIMFLCNTSYCILCLLVCTIDQANEQTTSQSFRPTGVQILQCGCRVGSKHTNIYVGTYFILATIQAYSTAIRKQVATTTTTTMLCRRNPHIIRTLVIGIMQFVPLVRGSSLT